MSNQEIVYRNDGSVTRWLEDAGNVAAGALARTTKYARNLHTDFTIVTHAQAPWVKLHAAAPPASLTGLAKYGQLIVKNDSGDSITVTVNDDSTDTLVLLDGETYPIEQDREIDKMAIAGSGSDEVYVWGLE